MRIALKAANNLYVSAEQGGGIDPRRSKAVAVTATRLTVGPWETFELVEAGDNFVALRTFNGNYITAEGGGGSFLRTDATTIGAWEMFLLEENHFKCWDGIHYLCAELGTQGVPVNATRTNPQSWETFEVEDLDPTPLPNTRIWKGAFNIPGVYSDIPYGDGQRIWTPAYGCYDDYWRKSIRNSYLARGYTHFVYNCAGLPYGSDYPELADDALRVERDLNELYEAGLIPVVCATDDRNRSGLCKSFVVNGPIIDVAFPMWEMNGVLNDNEQLQKNLVDATLDTAVYADVYLHFTPGHGSLSYDEPGGWHWCQEHGTVGLLAQGANRFPPEDPVTGGEGLDSTAIRLAGRTDLGAPGAWAGLQQLTVKFEYGVYDTYHGRVSEDAQRDYTVEFLKHAPHVVGYCDGGR